MERWHESGDGGIGKEERMERWHESGDGGIGKEKYLEIAYKRKKKCQKGCF